jgi:hypothetical protein
MLYGNLSDVIRNVTTNALLTLDLRYNHFTGTIPNFRNIRHIYSLHLTGNHFSGTLRLDYFPGLSARARYAAGHYYFDNNQFTHVNFTVHGTIKFNKSPWDTPYYLTINGYASNVYINAYSTSTWTLSIDDRLATTSTRLPILNLYPQWDYENINQSFDNNDINANADGYLIPLSLYGTTIIYNIINRKN